MVSAFSAGKLSKVSREMDIVEILKDIRSKKFEDKVHAVRTKGASKRETMPAFTVSGTFDKERKIANLKQHSGLIAIDVDLDTNTETDLQTARELLEKDKYTYSVFTSVGGFGIVWIVKINPKKHRDSYEALAAYLAEKYTVIADPSCKDVSRLRFVSWDPDLYLNQESKVFTDLPSKKEQAKIQEFKTDPHTSNDIDFVVQQITEKGVDLTDSYSDWFKIGMALIAEFGESGRQYFHAISSQSPKYKAEENDKQYTQWLKSDHARSGTSYSISSLYFMAKEAGVSIRSPRSNDAFMTYRQHRLSNPNSSADDALKHTIERMKTEHNMKKKEVETLLEVVHKASDEELRSKKVNKKLENIELFIKNYGFEFNEVYGDYEMNGKIMDNQDLNELYRKAMHVLGFDIPFNKVQRILDSNILPRFNPFDRYIESIEKLTPSGLIDAALDCFEFDLENQDPDLCRDFITRWMLGIISSMHGVHSVYYLLLCGEQGTGKTKFFRLLMPEDLRKYYSEKKLTGSKDDDIQMAQNLIVLDDEAGGMSKMESKKLKEMLSRTFFRTRLPYAAKAQNFKRWAVLCGTSNEEKVLTDMTGNRRIIPINVKNFDFEAFEKIDKDELFAELLHRYREDPEGFMLSKEMIDKLAENSEGNIATTIEEDLLAKYFSPAERGEIGAKGLTATEIIMHMDAVGTKNLRLNLRAVGMALKRQGYTQSKARINGKPVRVYYLNTMIDPMAIGGGVNVNEQPKDAYDGIDF